MNILIAALTAVGVYLLLRLAFTAVAADEPAERTREERLAPFVLPDRGLDRLEDGPPDLLHPEEAMPPGSIMLESDAVPGVKSVYFEGATPEAIEVEPSLRGTAESHIFKSGELYRDYVARAEKNGLRPVKYQNWLVVMSVGKDDGEMGRLIEAERQARLQDPSPGATGDGGT